MLAGAEAGAELAGASDDAGALGDSVLGSEGGALGRNELPTTSLPCTGT